MFPIAPEIVFMVIALIVVTGIMIGIFAGLATALILRLARKESWKDALLGGLGTFAGLFASFFVPWPETTTTTSIAGGGTMTETTHLFPHPLLLSFVLAASLPILRQLYKRKTSQMATHSNLCPLKNRAASTKPAAPAFRSGRSAP